MNRREALKTIGIVALTGALPTIPTPVQATPNHPVWGRQGEWVLYKDYKESASLRLAIDSGKLIVDHQFEKDVTDGIIER